MSDNNNIIKSDYFHHYPINNTVSQFLKSLGDFFQEKWFNNSTDIVVSSFSKAVQHFRNRRKEAGDKVGIHYPFVSMDFSQDFEPDPQAGRFFHQYPNFMSRFSAELFRPDIYVDDNIKITPCWNRYRGRVEMSIFCSSVYEYVDNRVMVFQFWGGLDRIITPVNVEGYIILPDEIITYTHDNPYTEEKYSIDWANSQADIYLVKNINKHKMCFPFKITPYLKLVSVSDGTEKYGGSGDDVSEHILRVEFEWECYIPTHIVIEDKNYPNFCPSKHILDVFIDYKYVPVRNISQQPGDTSVQFEEIPDDMHVTVMDTTEGTVVTTYVEFKETEVYFLTQEDMDNALNLLDVSINLNREASCVFTRIVSKHGMMKEGYNYYFTGDLTLNIRSEVVNTLNVGDSILIVYYAPPED